MKEIDIPGLGTLSPDAEDLGWHKSRPVPIPAFGGQQRPIVVEEYEGDPHPDEFHAAIHNFLDATPATLERAEAHIYKYYRQAVEYDDPEELYCDPITEPSGVWKHIQFGEPVVSRRHRGDEAVYVSIECECDWEPEHGLQIVLRRGLAVNKVGQYDGHLTNSDAYGDPSLEEVIYRE